MSYSKGLQAEKYARDYLIKQGLIWIVSNYHTKVGEIDLIMQDQDVLVFIEVRARKSSMFGNALESITYKKRQKLIKTALLYQQKYRYKGQMRFDVISMDGDILLSNLKWIKNAFGAEL